MAEPSALSRLNASASQMITTPKDLTDRIKEWREIAHVLTPAVLISSIAQQYAVVAAVVLIDAKIDKRGIGPEVYGLNQEGRGVPWLSQGEVSIGKVGLLKISQGAGIAWDPRFCGRVDDRKERYYWEYKAVGSYLDFDGRELPLLGTFALDLRDGSPALKGFTPAQIDSTRKAGLRISESKAMNAAIRELGVQQKYPIKELEKPFVMFRMVFQPDMKDPMQRRLYTERGLGATNMMYPSSRQLDAGAQAPEIIDVTPERQETAAPATTETPAGKVNTTTGEIVGERPATPATAPTGPTIVDIRIYESVTQKEKRPYTRHFIKLSDGRDLHTFDTEIGKLAETLKNERAPIEVTAQETKWGNEILELTRASSRLPYDDGPTEADLPKKL